MISLLLASAACGGLTAAPPTRAADAGPPTSAGAGTSPTGSAGAGAGGGSTGTGSGGVSADASSQGGASTGGQDAGGSPPSVFPCPDATLEPIVDPSVGAAFVAGRWGACAGVENLHGFGSNPSDVVGLDFGGATPGGGGCATRACLGGDLYLLVQGATGLVRGPGAPYHIYYELSGTELGLVDGSKSGSWTTAYSGSTSPRELDIQSTGYNTGTKLVAVQ